MEIEENLILISVVIPTHHRPEWLGNLLISLANQSLSASKYEIIVIASPNDTCIANPACSLNATIVAIPNDPWFGKNPSAKRNYGASIGKGTWIAFIDDDCNASVDWLLSASKYFPGNVVIEGAKRIPDMENPTFTHKGLKKFERPGGYQSCNMFFRKDIFFQIGGFDTRFPFYLEDSDLAWSFLDAGYAIPHANEAIVYHPTVPAQPKRLLDSAIRAEKLRLLQLKHPDQYKKNDLQILNSWQRIVLGLQVFSAIFLVLGNIWFSVASLLLSFILSSLVTIRWYWNCHASLHEIFYTLLLLPLLPSVAIVNYFRGCWIHRRYRKSLNQVS